MSILAVRAATALVLNAAAAYVATKRGSVTAAGGITGLAVGTGIFIGGGLWLWSLLMVFVVSASAVSRIGRNRKEPLQQLHEKGSRRDPVQVLANGGIGLIAAIGYAVSANPAFTVVCAASFASANADTWAGEIGMLSHSAPRSILTGKRLPPGTSGGITLLGLVASAAAAALIAAAFSLGRLLHYGQSRIVPLAATVIAAGITGALIDSLLGAMVQAHYTDCRSGKPTERRRTDGVENQLLRGWRGFNNDAVNVTSNLIVSVAVLTIEFV